MTELIKELEDFLKCEQSDQAQSQNQIIQIISAIYEDATSRRIDEEIYTEDKLITVRHTSTMKDFFCFKRVKTKDHHKCAQSFVKSFDDANISSYIILNSK